MSIVQTETAHGVACFGAQPVVPSQAVKRLPIGDCQACPAQRALHDKLRFGGLNQPVTGEPALEIGSVETSMSASRAPKGQLAFFGPVADGSRVYPIRPAASPRLTHSDVCSMRALAPIAARGFRLINLRLKLLLFGVANRSVSPAWFSEGVH